MRTCNRSKPHSIKRMPEQTKRKRVEHIMGTAISVDVRDLPPDEAYDAIEDVFDSLRRVDETFSTYQQGSEISRLGRGELTLAECSRDVLFVLDACEELGKQTDGYFDVRASGMLDPSGFVKGWAVEAASCTLVDHGSRHHCINAGGDVRVRGFPERERPWNIGVVHPRDRNVFTTVVAGTDMGIATSGSAERGGHVFDPHSGAPATDLVSVTVVGPELALTDAYATVAFAMGRRAPEWLGTLADREAYVIDAGGFAWWTEGFVRYAPMLASSSR